MLDLRPIHRVTDVVHTRFEDETLPKALSAAAFRRFDASKYSVEEVEWGRGAWEARILDEYRSQVAFTELLANLTAEGFGFDLLGVAVRVVRDELRHVELCRRMINALGGSDVIDGEPTWVNPQETLPRLDRILHTTVGFLCIGETVSVRLIAAVRKHTSDPLAHAVLTALTRDESIHGQYGFALLEAMLGLLKKRQLDWVRDLLPKSLPALEGVIRESGGEGEAASNPFGSLATRERLAVFRHAIDHDVVPAFKRLGLYRAPKRNRRRRGI